MKILSGNLRGHPIAQPKTRATRPMVEKARAALFDVTGPVASLTVLDVYAGSGAIGFEAASRGAALVESIESNERVARTIQANITALGLADVYVPHVMTLQTWLSAPSQNPPAPRYDLIVADPPHRLLNAGLLERLVPFLNPGGVLVLGLNGKVEPPPLPPAKLISTKNYGDVALAFYQR